MPSMTTAVTRARTRLESRNMSGNEPTGEKAISEACNTPPEQQEDCQFNQRGLPENGAKRQPEQRPAQKSRNDQRYNSPDQAGGHIDAEDVNLLDHHTALPLEREIGNRLQRMPTSANSIASQAGDC